MSIIKRVTAAFDLYHLGQCQFCVGLSFKLAMGSWLLLGTALLIDSQPLSIVALLSSPLSALWAAHVLAMAMRKTKVAPEGRRKFLLSFAKAFVGAAALSALPSMASADSACGGWSDGGCFSTCQRQDTNGDCHFCHSCCSDLPGDC